MSTQNNPGIPFSFSHNLSPIRLLELPPALLALLSNPDSPPTLKIKASSNPTASVHSTENHAVLCTPTQTYSLRQVYSSNSILLVQPSAPPPPTDADIDVDPEADPLSLLPPSIGLKVVSTANAYMELIPTIHDAETLLLRHISLYNTPSNHSSTSEKLSKSALLNALPISDAEFECAWKKLSCFTCEKGLVHRPAPADVLKTLSEIFTSAAAESFPLAPADGFDLQSLVAALDDDEEARIPVGLVEAAVEGVCDKVCEKTGKWRLQGEKCTAYVGRTLLEDWDGKGKGDMLYVSFMSRWKASVPEECSGLCKLELIKGWYTHPSQNTIRFVPGGAADVPPPVAAATTAKNKWHEKFGKGKRR